VRPSESVREDSDGEHHHDRVTQIAAVGDGAKRGEGGEEPGASFMSVGLRVFTEESREKRTGTSM